MQMIAFTALVYKTYKHTHKYTDVRTCMYIIYVPAVFRQCSKLRNLSEKQICEDNREWVEIVDSTSTGIYCSESPMCVCVCA